MKGKVIDRFKVNFTSFMDMLFVTSKSLVQSVNENGYKPVTDLAELNLVSDMLKVIL